MSLNGAYVLTHKRTGMKYVGSSKNAIRRVKKHQYYLRWGNHPNIRFREIWKEGDELDIQYILTNTREEAYAIEQKLIDEMSNHPTLLNIGEQVYGGNNLTRHPNKDDIIRRMTAAVRNRYAILTPQERVAIWGRPGALNGMYGRTHTQEAKDRISELKRGKPGKFGYTHTDETKALLSELAKAKTGEKNPFFGKQHSEETRRRLSEQNKGQLPPNLRRVVIDGVEYESVTEASRKLGVVPATILFRIKSNSVQFQGYRYVTEGPTTTETTSTEDKGVG